MTVVYAVCFPVVVEHGIAVVYPAREICGRLDHSLDHSEVVMSTAPR